MIAFLRQLIRLAAPYRTRLILGVIFGVLGGLIEPLVILTVLLVGRVVFPSAAVTPMGDPLERLPTWVRPLVHPLSDWFSTLPSGSAKILAVACIPAVVLARGLFGYLNIYFLQWAAVRTITDLRTRLFAHLQSLSLGFFTRSSTGDLMSRVIQDTGAIQATLSVLLAVIVKDPVKLAGLAALLVAYNAKLTAVTLVIFPVCVVPVLIYSRKVRRASAAIQDNSSELSTLMHESFTGNRIVKAYHLEETVIERFQEASRRFIGYYMRIVRSQEIPGPLIEFFGALGVTALFLYFAFQPNPSVEKLVVFAVTVVLMYQPIKNVARLHSQLEQARAASKRVFELLALNPTVVDPLEPVPLQAAAADIHFEAIDFEYDERPVLREVSLTVKSGQVVALVGPSGSGKTTLTNLLLRFYDPRRGRVRIGDTDIRCVALHDLRSQIAVVTQETILFNDTIRNNIRLGRPGATDPEVEAAARHAHAHEFILAKEHGFDSVVGEKGVMLSGGQRQRLAIARAILKAAPILVLDEATSSLDTESERAVQAALEELMKGRTTICIAHRLSTVQTADLIVVLEQGRIVDTGTHAQLIQKGGLYRKLYELQFQN
jgi:subfamily B ATP-binding cassette protein MsbA